MNRRAVVLALVLIAPACTHHQHVATLVPPAPGVEAIASLANGGEVEVVATTTPAGLRWVTSATEVHAIVDPADMRSFSTQRRGRAVLEGITIGGLSGAAAGGFLGLAAGCSGDTCLVSSGTVGAVGAIAGGALGIVVGAVSGLIVGSRDSYQLDTGHELMPRVSATAGNGAAAAALSWSY